MASSEPNTEQDDHLKVGDTTGDDGAVNKGDGVGEVTGEIKTEVIASSANEDKPSLAKPAELRDEDDDLEEGELKDDDDDDDDDDDLNDTNTAVKGQQGVSGTPNDDANDFDPNNMSGQPKKKRRRVVRKVKRKIKVIKKVPKKKLDQQQTQQQQQQAAPITQPLLPQNQQQSNSGISGDNLAQMNQPMLDRQQNISQPARLLPITTTASPNVTIAQQPLQPPPQQYSINSSNYLGQLSQPILNNQHNNGPPARLLPITTIASPNVTAAQPLLHPPQAPQSLSTTNTNPTMDSLWEQQILMLQELQKQRQAEQVQHDQQYADIIRAAATDEDLRMYNTTGTNLVSLQQQQQQLPPPPQHHQHQPFYDQNNHAPNKDLPPPKDQTPSSPDDEPSYEAISKMLTLLKNSSNLTDPADTMGESEQSGAKDRDDSLSTDANKPENSIEYTLVPVLVQGIDYTKYKLLSQYEPRFKNDPRLNQQT